MRKLWVLFCLSLFVSSCYNPTATPAPVSAYKPILIDKKDLVNSIQWLQPTELSKPGKYLLNGNYLYVVELYKGVHVYDNTNASYPVNSGFINIPGIQTISIKNNVLYVDNATDVVAIDINNPIGAKILSRIADVLPPPGPPDGLPLDGPVAQSTWPANTVAVAYVKLKN